ncbi:MAG TPA: PQQ-dependent sugar dehydrogenase [Opitutaceae bacterium]|nr:PQQ-dependent sugar dehydrogenase [Opitutaceae bacterium]
MSGQPLTRVPAASLRLTGTLPATTYTTTPAFAPTFTQPVALVSPPGDTRRLFVVEKTGRIWVIPDVTAATATRTLFLDLSARVTVSSDLNDERGLLALAFHPNYASNGQFYVWYTLTTTTGAGGGLHDRLARFRVSTSNPNVADADSEQPLISQRDEAANHNGGQLLFGPDGCLYLSLGDEGNADDTLQNSQRIDRDFFAGIIRIDVDQRAGSVPPNPHPSVHAGTYTVPLDNPFVGAVTYNGALVNPLAVRTEFWATGLRNPWRMSLDPATGRIWCGDVGQGSREEIDIIVRGGNYGWNYREGTIAGPRASPPAAAASSFIGPVWEYTHSEGQSITGGIVSRAPRLPELLGQYLFADFVSGRIWSLLPDGDNPVNASRVQLIAMDGGIASFGTDPSNGDVLLADLSEGRIKRLVGSTAGGTTFPATLSATGAFSDLASLTPAPGVVPYEPNVSFWSDHATKRRWFALPDNTSAFGFAVDGPWTLPTGAVWVKHFDLELTRGNPSTARRIETRFLVKTATSSYGLTYRWNDAQTEATLVPDEGADANFAVVENGVTRTQTWRFPSRAECSTCHTAAGGHALSFNTRQLNRDQVFPGGTANILTALAQAGYLNAPGTPAPVPAALPALARLEDTTKPIESRARAYLDVNCSQCHQPGGTAIGFWDARATLPLAATNTVNGALLDPAGDPGNRVIVPGDATHSRLLQRMSVRGPGQMPPLGTNERDLAGEALIAQWIASLGVPQAPSRLINLAARAQTGAGATALIPGFVIGAGAPKTVLIRAVGPKLADFGVSDAVAQPVLTLTQGTQTIATNTRWNTATNASAIRDAAARVGAFALPEGSADSALLATLEPGDYTAQAAASNNANGVALVEIYDADAAGPISASRLINTSVRAQVGTGGNILIPGLVISEGGSKTILVRAVGPGLARFGVTGFLPDPVVSVFSGSQPLLTNTVWNSAPNAADIRSAAERVGAFALDPGARDSALLALLPPGAYTIQVSGANNSTGVALVEVYEVP